MQNQVEHLKTLECNVPPHSSTGGVNKKIKFIGMCRVIYHIKTFLAMIRTTFKNLEKFSSLSGKNLLEIMIFGPILS